MYKYCINHIRINYTINKNEHLEKMMSTRIEISWSFLHKGFIVYGNLAYISGSCVSRPITRGGGSIKIALPPKKFAPCGQILLIFSVFLYILCSFSFYRGQTTYPTTPPPFLRDTRLIFGPGYIYFMHLSGTKKE